MGSIAALSDQVDELSLQEQTIIYQTRKITDIAADMTLMQMIVFDKIIQKTQSETKLVAVFKKKKFEQLSLFQFTDSDSGLIDIMFSMNEFGIPHQNYDKLREAIASLITLPIQMKEVTKDGVVWAGFTTLLAGVKVEIGMQRTQWNPEKNSFEVLEVPIPKKGYRQRRVILQFRKDILRNIIAGGSNGYIQLVRESLSMMISIYSNKIYKLIAGFYNDRSAHTPQGTSVHRISIEEFRKRMGLNDAVTQKPVRNIRGEIIRYEYTPRTFQAEDGSLIEDTRIYKNIRDLKRRVLEVGRKELFEKGNIFFQYRLTDSTGRKTKDVNATHIEFTVLRKAKGEINLATNADFISKMLFEIFAGKVPFNIIDIMTQENAIEIREYVIDAYTRFFSCTNESDYSILRNNLVSYLESISYVLEKK